MPVEVRVKVTLPLVLSLSLGVYTVFNAVFDGLNTPVPLVVQTPPVAVVITPFKTIFSFEHTLLSGPADTVGAGVMVTVILPWATAQAPVLVAVKVKRTDPLAMSANDGMYVPTREVAPAGNMPEPLVLQTPVMLPSVTLPFNDTIGLLAQTVWSLPTDTVAGLLITTVVLALALVHAFTVTVTLYLPSAARVILLITGFCWVDEKPLGPGQL